MIFLVINYEHMNFKVDVCKTDGVLINTHFKIPMADVNHCVVRND